MTLTELFEEHYLPRLWNQNRSERTIVEYRKTIGYWEKATNNMNVDEIAEKHIVIFNRRVDQSRQVAQGSPGFRRSVGSLVGMSLETHLQHRHQDRHRRSNSLEVDRH